MCLSVYLGSAVPIEELESVGSGGLGIELAKWTPPPLSKHEFVYYVGRKGKGADLECTCLLAEYVVWLEDELFIATDDTYPDEGPCPFETLRNFVEQGLRQSGHMSIICDDSGGVSQDCTPKDYDNLHLKPAMIRKENLIFADIHSVAPWRNFFVVRD